MFQLIRLSLPGVPTVYGVYTDTTQATSALEALTLQREDVRIELRQNLDAEDQFELVGDLSHCWVESQRTLENSTPHSTSIAGWWPSWLQHPPSPPSPSTMWMVVAHWWILPLPSPTPPVSLPVPSPTTPITLPSITSSPSFENRLIVLPPSPLTTSSVESISPRSPHPASLHELEFGESTLSPDLLSPCSLSTGVTPDTYSKCFPCCVIS